MSIKNFINSALSLALLTTLATAQTAPRTWQYYYKRGQLQFKAEMYDYAILSMDRALEMNPSLYQAANYMSDIYEITGKKLQSLEYMEESLKINPSQADGHNKIGVLYEYFEERDKAFSHFKSAVALDPRHVMGNINLVRYYIRQKQHEMAKRHFTVGYDKGKEYSDPLIALAAASEKQGKTDLAVELYARALEKNPAELLAYNRLFEIYRSKKEFRKAADTLERLIFFKPDHELAYIKLGHLYFTDPLPGKKERHLRKSIKYFQEAIRLNPGNVDTYFSLSQVFHYLGKNDEAAMLEEKIHEMNK